MNSKSNDALIDKTSEDDRKHRYRAAAFLGIVGCSAAIFGFSKTLARVKTDEHKIVQEGGAKAVHLLEGGSALALRALGWGTLYAILGVGSFTYGVWKLSGAKDFKQFRQKMGEKLPKLSKDTPPTSRTEFDGLNDLLNYLSTWGKK